MQFSTITRHFPPLIILYVLALRLYFALLSVLQSLFLDCHLFKPHTHIYIYISQANYIKIERI